MAGKGGSDDSGGIGGTLSGIGSVLGNALIPQTMDRFRAIDQGQRSSLVRSAVANELKNADGAVGSPTYYDYSKVLDGGPRTVKQAATPLMDDQTAAGALRAAMPEQFDAAYLGNRIAKMFPTPDYKIMGNDLIDANARGGPKSVYTGTPKMEPTELARLDNDLKAGRITQQVHDDAIAKANSIPGQDSASQVLKAAQTQEALARAAESRGKAAGQQYFQGMPPGLTGDDAYNWAEANLPGGAEIGAMARKIAAGQIKTPSAGRPGSVQEKSLALASMASPGVDFGQRFRTAQEFSQAGPTGKAISAINTTLMHTDKMLDAFDQMHNGQFPAWNKLRNTAATATGAPAPTQFATNRDAVASEARKVFSGSGGGGITELNEWKGNLPDNASPEQMNKSAQSLIDLMHGRLDPLVFSYNQTMGTNKGIEDWMTPRTRGIWNKLQSVAGGQTAATGAPAGAVSAPQGAPTQAPQAQAAPLPPGMVRQVGTYQGKPVFVDAQGGRHVAN